MRIPVLFLIAALSTAATEEEEGLQTPPPVASPLGLDMPSYQEPTVAWKSIEEAEAEQNAQCRDRIWQAREDLGQPELERQTASPDEPLLMWAVDHRRDGCGVIVMKDDPEDIRPIPERDDSTLLIPAQGEQSN